MTVIMVMGSLASASFAHAGGDVDVMEQPGIDPVETPSMLKVARIEVAHIDSTLKVSFSVNPQRVNPGSDRQVVFTPVVRSMDHGSADSIVFQPLIVAGRNRYYTHIRNGRIADGEEIYKAGEKGMIEYTREVAWADWMENGYIYMREETQNCCKPVKPLCDTPIAQITPIPQTRTNGIESVRYIALTGDNSVELEAQGSAFIDFIVNRTEIREDYRKNPRELKKIIESIDVIKNDPDATITRLSIMGFASPEGSYDNNVRLAMGRTEALKEYVRKMYNLDPEIMTTSYEPEDWKGLRNWLLTSSLPNREAILAIVDSDLAPDPKDAAIKKKFPRDYKVLLDSVYPALRHSDYTVRYKIRTFLDIEELKRVYNESPERLRPVDFYRIAKTYPEGSEEFEDVLLFASKIYPQDEEAAINAANILMSRGDMVGASEKLSHAGERGEAYYTRGMLAEINGDHERAERMFTVAKELGIEEAGFHLNRMKEKKAKEMVMYLIETQE